MTAIDKTYMKNNITLKVSKEILEEMCNSGNKILKEIAIKACPELACPKLTKFLKEECMSKKWWDILSTFNKAQALAGRFNSTSSSTPKNDYVAGIYWNKQAAEWRPSTMDGHYIGMVVFKTYEGAALAADILNECNAK